jgi:hypothetical protein
MTPTKLNIMNHPKIELPVSEKAVLSPKEFAALFGRQYVWAYRQISAGNIKVLTNLGRIMIPRSEVGRLLEAQHVYAGMVRTPRPKNARPNAGRDEKHASL